MAPVKGRSGWAPGPKFGRCKFGYAGPSSKLYNSLTGKAWVYGEELDFDLLARADGVQYFLEWIQTRFMEMEVSKISQVMGDLFRRLRRKPVTNVEFERLVLG